MFTDTWVFDGRIVWEVKWKVVSIVAASLIHQVLLQQTLVAMVQEDGAQIGGNTGENHGLEVSLCLMQATCLSVTIGQMQNKNYFSPLFFVGSREGNVFIPVSSQPKNFCIDVFSWKTTSHKGLIEIYYMDDFLQCDVVFHEKTSIQYASLLLASVLFFIILT